MVKKNLKTVPERRGERTVQLSRGQLPAQERDEVYLKSTKKKKKEK